MKRERKKFCNFSLSSTRFWSHSNSYCYKIHWIRAWPNCETRVRPKFFFQELLPYNVNNTTFISTTRKKKYLSHFSDYTIPILWLVMIIIFHFKFFLYCVLDIIFFIYVLFCVCIRFLFFAECICTRYYFRILCFRYYFR